MANERKEVCTLVLLDLKIFNSHKIQPSQMLYNLHDHTQKYLLAILWIIVKKFMGKKPLTQVLSLVMSCSFLLLLSSLNFVVPKHVDMLLSCFKQNIHV